MGNDLFWELQQYLVDNFISYSVVEDDYLEIVQIGEETYELFAPNDDGKFFDESFHWDCEKTECNNYIFRFGGNWMFIKKGTERAVKLERVKYLGKINVEEDFLMKNFLGIHGAYDMNNGSGLYSEWCKKAKWLGIKKLGICEKGTIAGILKFQITCKKNGITPILGMEVPVQITNKDCRYTVKAFVKNEIGWSNLLKINKIINIDNPSHYIKDTELAECTEGLFIIYDPKTCEFENLPSYIYNNAENYFQFDCCQYVKNERDKSYLLNLSRFIKTQMKPVLMNDAYYVEKEYAPIRKILNAIGKTMNYESHDQYFKNGLEFWEDFEYLYKDKVDEMTEKFIECVENLDFICDNCCFTIDTSKRHLPKYHMTLEESKLYGDSEEMFVELVYKGLEDNIEMLDLYGEDVLSERIEKEIEVIKEGNVFDYFLTLRDIVNWCKNNNILLGAGRGSACGSLCSYLLGITKVDPLKYNLLFERFLNRGRVKVSLPDIDTDFGGDTRPLVKKYMEERFGASQVCSVGTFGTFQLKAALDDLCRQHKINFFSTQSATKKLDSVKDKTLEDFFKKACTYSDMNKFTVDHPDIINEMMLLLGLPRNCSVHACAVMIFPDEKNMYEWCPVRDQKGLLVTEWEGVELDEAGFLKEDILGIEQLDKMQDAVDLIEKNCGKRIDLYKDIDIKDEKVYKFMSEGFLGDVFQFGATGLSSYCTQLKPESIEELSICSSLFRPGCIENNFHNEYILRKNGEREIEYRIGTEDILNTTKGLFVFQEQVMALMNKLGGMDLITCDTARKAMGKKKIDVLKSLQVQFVEGYCNNFGVSESYAQEFWEEILKASSYLFNLSHAVAYSINGYNSAWLKYYYPIEFWSVTLTRAKELNIPYYIREISLLGDIKILPVGINKSSIEIVADKENNSIFWALIIVKEIGTEVQKAFMAERNANGPYFSLEEFIDRQLIKGSAVNKAVIENLIYAGAFDEIEGISDIRHRERLLLHYRELKKVKIDESKDEYSLALKKGKTKYFWWWQLQQKDKSSFATFNYRELVEMYLYPSIDSDIHFYELSEVLCWDNDIRPTEIAVGGYVLNVEEKTSKKGPFCNLILESNYEIIKVVVFPDIYSKNYEFFKNIKKNILLMNGNIVFDRFTQKHILQAINTTQFVKIGII